MKNKGWKIAYIIIVVILIAAICVGLKYVWDQCLLYQSCSANTLVMQAKEELEEKLGFNLQSNFIPKTDDGKIYDYVLNKDKKTVAKITLEQTGSGIMNLAHFKLKEISPLSEYKIVYSEGDIITVDNVELNLSGISDDYTIQSSDTLKEGYFGFPEFKVADITSVYDISQIKVERNGQELPLVQFDENLYYAAQPIDEELQKEIKSRAIDIADIYSHYVSDDIEFGTLYGYILSYSPVIPRLASVINEWYAYHASAVMENIKISDPLYLGEDWVLISTSFDYCVDVWTDVEVFPTDLSFILYKYYGDWYVAELSTYLIYNKIPMLEY